VLHRCWSSLAGNSLLRNAGWLQTTTGKLQVCN
jgi:hypothetical protein